MKRTVPFHGDGEMVIKRDQKVIEIAVKSAYGGQATIHMTRGEARRIAKALLLVSKP